MEVCDPSSVFEELPTSKKIADIGRIIKVELRDLLDEDLVTLEGWAQHATFHSFMSRMLRNRPANSMVLRWWIVIADDKDVGVVWLEETSDPGEANLGIMLGDSELLGKGIRTQAVKLALDRGAQIDSLYSICINVREDNVTAIKYFEECGFKISGSTFCKSGDEQYRVLAMRKELGFSGRA